MGNLGRRLLTLISAVFFFLATTGIVSGQVIFVKHDASGAEDGTSWTDAFSDLETALDVAADGNEIWVAAGVYKPSVERGGEGERFLAFQLKNGVGVYGGFSGAETSRDQRDWQANETILSGDLLDDDDDENICPFELTRQDNCLHLFMHDDVLLEASTILDGFTITGGNANNPDVTSQGAGGGMFNSRYASPTIRNCLFTKNTAIWGGAIYSFNGAPTLIDSSFVNNHAPYIGGAVYSDSSEIEMIQ